MQDLGIDDEFFEGGGKFRPRANQRWCRRLAPPMIADQVAIIASYTACASGDAVSEYLNQRGILTSQGRPWTSEKVRKAIGEIQKEP